MGIFKNKSGNCKKLKGSSLSYERELENILLSNNNLSKLNEEELFVVGVQIEFEGVKDILDILAIDKSGKAVIIELKTKFLNNGTKTDIQSLKYASYVSTWDMYDFKNAYEDFYKEKTNKYNNFDKEISKFLDTDVSYINSGQRIMIIASGSEENTKLNYACSFLKSNSIDINLYKYIQYNNGIIDFQKVKFYLKKCSPKPNKKITVEDHIKKADPLTQKIIRSFISNVQDVYNLKYPSPTENHIVFKKEGKSRIQIRVNKNSMMVYFFNRFHKKFNKKKIEKKIKNNTGYSIFDKIKYGDEGHT